MSSDLQSFSNVTIVNLFLHNRIFFLTMQKFLSQTTWLYLNKKHIRFCTLFATWKTNFNLYTAVNKTLNVKQPAKKIYRSKLMSQTRINTTSQKRTSLILHNYTEAFDLDVVISESHNFLGTKISYRDHTILKTPHVIKQSLFRRHYLLKRRNNKFLQRKYSRKLQTRKKFSFLNKILSNYLILTRCKTPKKQYVKKQPKFFTLRQIRSQKIWKNIKKRASYTPYWRPNVDRRFNVKRTKNFFNYKSVKPYRAKNFKWRKFKKTKNFRRFAKFSLTRLNISPLRTTKTIFAQKSYKLRIRIRKKSMRTLKTFYEKNYGTLSNKFVLRTPSTYQTFSKHSKFTKQIRVKWRKRRFLKKFKRLKKTKFSFYLKHRKFKKRKFNLRSWKSVRRAARRFRKRLRKVRRRTYKKKTKKLIFNILADKQLKVKRVRRLKKRHKRYLKKKKIYKRFYKPIFRSIFHDKLRRKRSWRFIRWKWFNYKKARSKKKNLKRRIKKLFLKIKKPFKRKRRNIFKRRRFKLKRLHALKMKLKKSSLKTLSPQSLFLENSKLINFFKKHQFRIKRNSRNSKTFYNHVLLNIKKTFSARWFKKYLLIKRKHLRKNYLNVHKKFCRTTIRINKEFRYNNTNTFNLTLNSTTKLNKVNLLSWNLISSPLTLTYTKHFNVSQNLPRLKFSIRPYAHHFFSLSPLAFFYSIKQRRDWQSMKEYYFKKKLWLFFKSHFDFMDANEMKKQFFRNVMSKKKSQLRIRFWKLNPYKNFHSKKLNDSGNSSLFLTSSFSATQTKFSSELNYRLKSTKDYKIFMSRRPVHYRVRRIRYKPGYSTQWRRHRRKVLIYLRKYYRFQHRLTLHLQKLYFQNIHINPHPVATPTHLTLGRLLLITKFSHDIYLSTELMKHELVFLNGFRVINSLLKVFQGDVMQFIVNFKFYLMFRFLKIWSARKLAKIKRTFYKKTIVKQKAFLLLFHKRKTQLPTWIFDLEYAFSGIPHFVELDYFTLSVLLIDNPDFHWTQWKFLNRDNRKRIYSSYNWKYIN